MGSGVLAEDRFGEEVAIDGEFLLSANRNEDQRGAVYVFKRTGQTWAELTKLSVDDLLDGERLGTSVLYEDPYAFIGGSSIRVFARDGDSWSYEGKLSTNLGQDLRPLDASENVLVAARSFLNSSGTGSVHEVYVFELVDGVWTQRQHIVPDDIGVTEFRTVDAAVSGDDIVIGTRETLTLSEAVYSFVKTDGSWQFQTSFAPASAAAIGFRISEIAIQGDIVVIGDNSQTFNGEQSGAAFVFRRDNGVWSEIARIVPEDGIPHDRFGISVDVDESHILIGQDGHQVGDTVPSGFGSSYVYSVSEIVVTGIREETPAAYKFSSVFPNPFMDQASVTLSSDRQIVLELALFDILGRKLRTVYRGEVSAGSSSTLTIDATDLSPGPYVLRASSEHGVESRSVVVVR